MKRGYLLLALLYGAVIWHFSGQPGSDVFLPDFWDKPVHFLEYAVLGFLLARGLGGEWGYLFLAWLLAALYGLVDEYHQSFVKGRIPSALDFLSDALGAAAGAAAGYAAEKARLSRRRGESAGAQGRQSSRRKG